MALARLLRATLALLALLAGLPAATLAAGPAPREYTVAVIPIMPPAEVKRRWQPILDEATRATGLRFRFHFYPDFARFEQGLMADEVDFAMASPVVIWNVREHYRPLFRGRMPLLGQVVVRHDSPLQALPDLAGHTLGLQEGTTLSTNLLVLRTLREQKIAFEPHYMNTESSALRSVVLGRNDAALVNNYLMQLVPPGILPRLRVIHTASELPPPAMLACRQTPAEVALKFRDALFGLRTANPALLDSIFMADITDADLDRDYGVMGRLLATDPAGERP